MAPTNNIDYNAIGGGRIVYDLYGPQGPEPVNVFADALDIDHTVGVVRLRIDVRQIPQNPPDWWTEGGDMLDLFLECQGRVDVSSEVNTDASGLDVQSSSGRAHRSHPVQRRAQHAGEVECVYARLLQSIYILCLTQARIPPLAGGPLVSSDPEACSRCSTDARPPWRGRSAHGCSSSIFPKMLGSR